MFEAETLFTNVFCMILVQYVSPTSVHSVNKILFIWKFRLVKVINKTKLILQNKCIQAASNCYRLSIFPYMEDNLKKCNYINRINKKNTWKVQENVIIKFLKFVNLKIFVQQQNLDSNNEGGGKYTK